MTIKNENEILQYAENNREYAFIEKLLKLKNKDTFWNDARKLTKHIYSDHIIGRYQCFAEWRFEFLENGGKENDN